MISHRLVWAGYKADDWLILGGLVEYTVLVYQIVRLILTPGDVHGLFYTYYLPSSRPSSGCPRVDVPHASTRHLGFSKSLYLWAYV